MASALGRGKRRARTADLESQGVASGVIPEPGAREGLEHETHVDGIPEFAARTAVLLRSTALLDESEFAIKRDRRKVVRKDAEDELVQASLSSQVDRGSNQRRPNPTASPLARDSHPNLAETVSAHADVDEANDLSSRRNSHQVPVEPPTGRTLLDVNRRLRRNPVTLLGNSRKENRQ